MVTFGNFAIMFQMFFFELLGRGRTGTGTKDDAPNLVYIDQVPILQLLKEFFVYEKKRKKKPPKSNLCV